MRGALARLAAGRAPWLAAGLAALGLEAFSVAFFQGYLRLLPCELCVKIRFSMLVIALGAFVAAVAPRRPWWPRLAGMLPYAYGALQGLAWDIALEAENLAAAAEGGACSLARPHFPLGLPLDKWLPRHFTPLALCGQDSNWGFLGLNMAEWLLPVYGCFIALPLLQVALHHRQHP